VNVDPVAAIRSNVIAEILRSTLGTMLVCRRYHEWELQAKQLRNC